MQYLKYIIKGSNPKKLGNIVSRSVAGLLEKKFPKYPNEAHIKSAMEWLSIAQKQNNDGGVSALYSLFEGWAPSYVETTGYIIPTFYNYAEITKNPAYREKDVRMAEFEL